MEKDLMEQVTLLRHQLHQCPERSGEERQTKEMLMSFLRERTSLELYSCGDGFYAAHREETPSLPSIAIRADYDALAMPDGSAAHLCGHDGHSAALCGLGLMLEGQRLDRSVFLLFQPGEETGEGAKGCLELFEMEQIDEIYGGHNLPGFPLGQVVTREGTFACASEGMTIRFMGSATHAAYPELGRSPAYAVGQLLCSIPQLSSPEQYRGMTLCTVIGVKMGEKAFGAAAADAEVWLTLRGEHTDDLERLDRSVLKKAEELAEAERLSLTVVRQDVFPATENDAASVQKIIERMEGTSLERPMRWSEDFGHYLIQHQGAFFGIGAGLDCPGLHTDYYEYPDPLLKSTMQALWKLIQK